MNIAQVCHVWESVPPNESVFRFVSRQRSIRWIVSMSKA
jgi:hypothetical protein